ncbi:Metaxin-1 [Daphnia sinensis]|uniref:Metaxin-1 n=1 Tax=Daphnia sinensis TaxID=1820382 RepID=A0AAD5KN01_9CRUS|nr:Metaxin-1 [Daphnia sinensis]
MASNPVMELEIWKGEWGLPSVDVNCLEVMTYAKFSGTPLKTKITNNPFKTPHGSLPVFQHENECLTKFGEISAYLRKNNHTADFELSPKQCAEAFAYSHLIYEKLVPALQFVWWIDSKNFVEFTRPLYAKLLPFPLNFYYPGQYEKHAKQLAMSLYPEEEDLSVIETAVYRQADECLCLLATKLGEKEFFFGQSPSSLDAVVFAHLAPLLKAPLPSAALQNHLKACTNLTRFVGRVLQRYFPKEIKDHEQAERKPTRQESEYSDPEFPNKLRNISIAALVSLVAMTAYAMSTGIIQVVPADEGEED